LRNKKESKLANERYYYGYEWGVKHEAKPLMPMKLHSIVRTEPGELAIITPSATYRLGLGSKFGDVISFIVDEAVAKDLRVGQTYDLVPRPE
jgi:hypothetical protein